MPFLTLSHVTRYTYRQPVAFGEHRIMVRPRESHDQQLISAELTITPEPSEVRWLHDVFGNSVAIATSDRRARELVFDSRVRLDHSLAELATVDIEQYARSIRSPIRPRTCPTCCGRSSASITIRTARSIAGRGGSSIPRGGRIRWRCCPT
ncbi:transglutaminase N-terminal domain-containing protein [Sphingomonas aerolata]|uniref:transglutaminase N-terminal domain-containing protein n=1 Tax=Sphingomonas aerolata TaxID=185951 RepID=UPI002FE23FFB